MNASLSGVLDAVNELEKLHQRDIQFKSLSQDFDTTTPEGKLLYVIVAALAEWEKQIISQRIKEGLYAARKRGKKLGRPLKLTKTQAQKAMRTFNNDPRKTITGLAAELRVCPKTLSRAMNKL